MTRIDNVRTCLEPGESFLVTNLINVRYLCGYSGSNGALLITPDDAILVTDSRYEIQAQHETHDVSITLGRDVIATALALVGSSDLACEGDHVTLNQGTKIFEGRSVRATSKIVETFRQVKDESEIELIRRACSIATTGLELLIAQGVLGLSEIELSHRLRTTLIECGADDIAFETIVASGPHSAIPHHQPTSRIVERGDFLKIDFGARFRGYLSDCTRTFSVGKPSAWQTEIYAAVQSAQQAGRQAISVESSCADVLAATRNSLTESGYLEHFTHGLGHGVGLEIHEDPFLSMNGTDRLMPGTVVTVEPGVYFENRGGVRIEDTVLVTHGGYENLTEYSYELQDIS